MRTNRFLKHIITLLVLLWGTLFSDVVVELVNDDTQFVRDISRAELVECIRDALDLTDENTPFYKASAKLYFDENNAADYIGVYLFSKKQYLAEGRTIDIDGDYRVLSVSSGYTAPEENGDGSEPCRSCPDPEIEMLFTTCEDGIPSAVFGINTAYDIAVNAGYSAKKIIGSEVTADLIKAYLTCPNLKLYGRIGHGHRDGILLANHTRISEDWVNNQATDHLKDKIIYLNSCFVHNTPFEPLVMARGTKAFVGGVAPLWINWSEYVFNRWLDKILTNGEEFEQALKDSEEEENYPRGDHGITKNKKGAMYYTE